MARSRPSRRMMEPISRSPRYRRKKPRLRGAGGSSALPREENFAVYSMSLAGVPHPDRRRAQSDIAAWTATPGRILSVAARFPLYETAAAHKAVEAGGKVGTVVVEPQL